MIDNTAQRLADIAGTIKRALRVGGGVSPTLSEGIVPVVQVFDILSPEYCTRFRWALRADVNAGVGFTGFLGIGNYRADGAIIVDQISITSNQPLSPQVIAIQQFIPTAGTPGGRLLDSAFTSATPPGISYDLSNAANSPAAGDILESYGIGGILASTIWRARTSVPYVLRPKPAFYNGSQADWLYVSSISTNKSYSVSLGGYFDL